MCVCASVGNRMVKRVVHTFQFHTSLAGPPPPSPVVFAAGTDTVRIIIIIIIVNLELET